MLPFLFGKSFDDIAQHGSWHAAAMGIEEGLKRPVIVLPRHAQHPAGSLMYQLLGVIIQQRGQSKDVSSLLFIMVRNPSYHHQDSDQYPHAQRNRSVRTETNRYDSITL